MSDSSYISKENPNFEVQERNELDEEDLNQWDNPDLWEKASPIQMGFPEGRKTLMEECQKAKDLGLKVIWALSLPGKTAPLTSGKIIKETISNIFYEEGV